MDIKILTNSQLKFIAMVAMLIDHIGVICFDANYYCQLIGRISFPIFCFLLIEGYSHTKNLYKYGIRLGVFAVISEPIYDLAFYKHIFYPYQQNVFFTLFFGLICISLATYSYGIKDEYFDNSDHRNFKEFSIYILNLFFVVLLYALIMKTFLFLNPDYGILGLALILAFYFFRNNFLIMTGAILVINCLEGGMQAFAGMALIPIFFYNGQRGTNVRYIWYLFYPLHLLIPQLSHRKGGINALI
jgi:hypothetical protein